MSARQFNTSPFVPTPPEKEEEEEEEGGEQRKVSLDEKHK